MHNLLDKVSPASRKKESKRSVCERKRRTAECRVRWAGPGLQLQRWFSSVKCWSGAGTQLRLISPCSRRHSIPYGRRCEGVGGCNTPVRSSSWSVQQRENCSQLQQRLRSSVSSSTFLSISSPVSQNHVCCSFRLLTAEQDRKRTQRTRAHRKCSASVFLRADFCWKTSQSGSNHFHESLR